MGEQAWTVHKFGGTSVASAERYHNVAAILAGRAEREGHRQAVVVSAMGGMTDALLGTLALASARDAGWRQAVEALRTRLHETIDALGAGAHGEAVRAQVDADLANIEDLLHATWLLKTAPPQASDLIVGHGELWSAQLLHALLVSQGVAAAWLDARDALVVRPIQGNPTPQVLMEASQARLDAWLAAHTTGQTQVLVITGFIASTERDELPTTLGRNGSDYSAALCSALLHAHELTIWTDVSGVLSANPKVVPEAVALDALSYQEAMELAYFGAKVLHPSTMAPAVASEVVIYIKNTFAPEDPGTRIHTTTSATHPIKGFATIDQMALINLEGTNMMGVPGIAHRLFGALKEAQISVVMISQGSSEHSICFVIPAAHAAAAREAVEHAFFAERHQGQLQSLEITAPCSILAAVGDQMSGQVGLAGRFFGALGNAHVNIRAIAQGSSERNISVVIDSADTQRALRAVHSAFYLSHQTLSIGLIGPGVVGKTLLEQIAAQRETLRQAFNVDLRVRAIATSERMALAERELALDGWQDAVADGQPTDLGALVDHVDADFLPHAVLIDCTASAEVAARYTEWLGRGVHVITPNKKANTGPLDQWRTLKATRRSTTHYLYETTVGAGLPIIHTLRDLVETGDEVEQIEGILSGTLSYLFNSFTGERPFSAIVAEARQRGYTEPDPRDDLSGMDVARKITILARELGADLALEDVAVQGLVPPALVDGTAEAFMAALPSHDEAMLGLLREAQAEGAVLRYIGKIAREGDRWVASVSLQKVPESSPFGRVQLTDNLVRFTTRRYQQNPLVVQGPGAGPDVTAGGVFADLLRLSSYLGGAR